MKNGFYLSPCGKHIIRIDKFYSGGSHSLIEQHDRFNISLVESYYLPDCILEKITSYWHYLGK